MTEPTSDAVPPRRGWRIRTRLLVIGLLAAPVLLFGAYTWLSLTWSYSEGERAGILQKFSRKGWLCKTYEGELAMAIVPGVAPVIWEFSARDEAVAARLRSAIGQSVALHYREHRGVPTNCFGLTDYFVDSVRIVQRADTGR